MKVYLLYLKKDKTLYAFTATKKFYEKFLLERNPKCFIKKKVNMEESEFSHFLYSNKSCQLIEDVLETKDKTTSIICTIHESKSLEEELDNIDRYANEIMLLFQKYPLKKKYQNAIDHLSKIDDGNGHLLINTLSLFVDLHKDTFIT